MSIKLMSLAWEADSPPSEKILLLALCDHANDEDFTCYPSTAHLSKKTSLHKATIFRILDSLKEQKIISIIGSKKQTNVYKIDIIILKEIASRTVRHVAPRDTTCRTTRHHMSHHATPHVAPRDMESLTNHHLTINESKDLSSDESLDPKVKTKSGKIPTAHFYRKSSIIILDFLSKKSERKYQHVDSHLNLISARLKEVIKELSIKEIPAIQKCKQVIAKKSRDWLTNDKMNYCIRPKTLFAKSNFWEYMAELKEVKNDN